MNRYDLKQLKIGRNMSNEIINILLVEDEKIAQKMAVITLEQLNIPMHVDIASTGNEALDFFNTQKYDVIFMDLGLPNTNGLEVTRQMKALKENKDIPTVALTAHGDDIIKEECKNAGMIGFIEKPLTLEKCRQIFNELGFL